MPTNTRRRRYLVALLIVTSTAILGAAWQQTRQDDAQTLAGVSAELRLLRLSVESSLRSQTEMNAMGVLLATVQTRITQLTARLDGIREELTVASEKVRELSERYAHQQKAIAAPGDAALREDRTVLANETKQEYDKAYAREQNIRTREMQLQNDLRLEEARWTEFVARLEQITRR